MSTRSVAASAAVAVIASLGMLPTVATAAPAPAAAHDPASATAGPVDYDLPGPLTEKVKAEQEEATRQLLAGTAKIEQHGSGTSIKLGPEKYVELARQRTDKIFTILVDFGDQVDTTTKTADGKLKYGGTPGPAHNQIEKPDAATNNSTAWRADYNQQHFQDLYFNPNQPSMKTFYERQSSGRYSVDGQVTDWVRVPWNEARYGSDYCGAHICNNAQDLIRDGINAWVADQKAKGQTDAQIKATLSQYDQYDRYDFNHNGNFNEPDGYLDHFQIVHAGEDESAGGGKQGTDALWAHRSYVYGAQAGQTGPAGNKLGGTPVGDTGIWVGDYTMQPENGGLGVFAHEFGHDLGLPDLYDTTGKDDNSVGFWSLMSSGSWLGEGKNEIGDMPNDFDVWSKLKLGWLNYAQAQSGKTTTVTLGPVEYNTAKPQALVVTLPKKTVTTTINTPFAGNGEWWSGSADNLDVTLTRDVDLTGKTSATLAAKGWYDLEQDYDYGYAEVSTDGGANWTAIDGTFDGKAIEKNPAGKAGLTGSSAGKWGDLSYSLNAYAGKAVKVRFHNTTDGGVHNPGFALDNISITADGATVLSDDAEHGANGWTATGFSLISGKFSKDYDQYYLAENRQYVSYDATLKTGPYNFGFSKSKPNWVEHYANQDGLLIWLWDTSQSDNNVTDHPGSGLILPIDAHPTPLKWADGTLMRSRLQGYDSTFGFDKTDGLKLHKADEPVSIYPTGGNRSFNDHTRTYWDPSTPFSSVKVPDTHTGITVLWESLDKMETTVQVKAIR
ncbi:immune inhibitor A domain-containing protein [Kitasatospora sp. McL0602]|uniref:immune inhibitor A domain-containing protein n=1 Tax=Kitasatospora sp. McL0602 TaxID=3439530 RepID=UPI003F8A0D3C